MTNENTTSFTSIVSVNPYSNEYIHSTSSLLAPIKNPVYEKEQLVVSYLNTQSYINNHINISKNIPDEDLLDAINIKIYDELGLDQAIEYQIQYIETFNNLDTNDRHFQVFIVDPLQINETFQEAIDTIKYIDVITPAPLLIKSLYLKEIIESNGVDCFIYFEEHDAFITLYNEKNFVYTKSLNYSLLQMHERFCELYGERIEYQEFIDFLSQENLKYTSSEYKEFIFKLYKEIFANINDILAYTKKAFEIEKVEQIYIGTQIDIASKLYEIAEVELEIPSNDFNFNYGFDESTTYVDQIHALLHITTTLENEEKYQCNFSSFHRPPKFIKRESGKLLILGALSFFIAFVYPISYWALTYTQELQYKLLQDSYTSIHAQKSTREAKIKNKQAEKEKISALLKEEKESYMSKKNTLVKIHDVKVNYPMKAKLITKLTNNLNKYAVNLETLSYSETDSKKTFTLSLLAAKDKKITSLLKYLTMEYDNIFQFHLKSISYDETRKSYISELKVDIL